MGEKKTALVTGSTAGIGKAIALRLAGLDCHVLINGRRETSDVRQLISEIKALSKNCTYIQGDISDKETRDKIIDNIDSLGRLDILVNNAGRSTRDRKDILSLEERDIMDVFKVNIIAPMLLTSALVPFMQMGKDRSYIINISSISSYTISTNRADYCISKAGLSMMTGLFAARLAEDNIGVFEIRPGIIATDMTAPVKGKYDKFIAEKGLPMPRWGQPQDIAKAVEAIVLGYFPYSTGETINVDGGFHIRRL